MMNTCRSSVAFVIALGFVLFALPAQSVTMISSPPDFSNSYTGGAGAADTLGGTFTATEDTLISFSLFLGIIGGSVGSQVQAVLLETDGLNAPTGLPIWSSSPFLQAVGPVGEVGFNPDITLTLGASYFIGVDTGIFNTGLNGGNPGDISVAFAVTWSGDTNPGGSTYTNTNGAGFALGSGSDIATNIVLDTQLIPNPEPGTFTLVMLGLVGLGARRRL